MRPLTTDVKTANVRVARVRLVRGYRNEIKNVGMAGMNVAKKIHLAYLFSYFPFHALLK